MVVRNYQIERADLAKEAPQPRRRSGHLGADRLHPAARCRHRSERIDRASDGSAQGVLRQARIVERADYGGDPNTITAELLQSPLFDCSSGLAPQLPDPAARLLQDRVGQLQKLETQPAADLDGPASLTQPQQRRRLAPRYPACMLPHPVDRQIRDHDPVGPEAAQCRNSILDVAYIPASISGCRCTQPF
jgi:hypothetical protein